MKKNKIKKAGKNKKDRKKRDKKQKKKLSKKPSADNSYYNIPNPFENLSNKERAEVIKSISEKSRQECQDSLERIKAIFKRYDPFILLATLASYGLTVPLGDEGIQVKDSEMNIYQYHLEFLQAVVLQNSRNELGKELFGPNIVLDLWDLVKEHMDAHTFMSLEERAKSDSQNAVETLLEHMRGNTKGVRNWGYFSQVKNIAKEMYGYFDNISLDKYGFSITDVLDVFQSLLNIVEEKNTIRYEQLRELMRSSNNKQMVYNYYDLIGVDKTEANQFIDKICTAKLKKKTLFSMLVSHYDIRLADIYSVDLDAVVSSTGLSSDVVKSILNKYSLFLGSLKEYTPDYIYLSNPVWNAPLIKMENGSFFCLIPQVFFSFVLENLDKLVEPISDQDLSQRKSDYLEKKVKEIICRRFPDGMTESSVKWFIEGVQYETDLVTFIDSYALVVEVKSGKITVEAKRGAQKRLQKHIDELLIKPNIQSKRFQDRLIELISNPDIEDELREKLPVDLSQINKIVRVSVTLDDLASIQANIKQIAEAGWLPDGIEFCPTMTLADFETLFDILEHPVQILHYLEARQIFEQKVKYVGDELDLIGFYMHSLLSIGEVPPDYSIVLTEESSPIDAYYNSMDAGVVIEKPKPDISELFSSFFTLLETRKNPRWTEVGILLNKFSPQEQKILSSKLKELQISVQKDWKTEGHNNILIFTPGKHSSTSLCIFLYKNNNANRRNEFIDSAINYGLDPSHVKECLIIGIIIDDSSIPYHFIGLFKRQNN